MKLFLAIIFIIPTLVVRAQGPPYGKPITDAAIITRYACVVLVKSTKECSGVMVGPRHVVTAAQCVTDGAKVAESKNTFVTSSDLQGRISSSSKTVSVTKIIVHDKYVGGSNYPAVLVQNDLAFLRLSEAVDPFYKDSYFKVCPIAPNKPSDGTAMLMIGFQEVNQAKDKGLVEYATKVRSSDKCVEITDSAKKKGYTNTICTVETQNTYCEDTVIGGGLFTKGSSSVGGINIGTTLTGCNTGVTYFHLSLTGFSKQIQDFISKYP
ncbi:uncharacterized protein LOC134835452 [Culicoides brevitarsis]|uniref:uncharacterized protein LOC134835452 n=1 Tax=Culicoides brevitarsis TaxID=469753 RepID=UPI00307BAEC9